MRSGLAGALVGAAAQLCLPLAASAQGVAAGAPPAVVAPMPLSASGAEGEGPDIGLEGGGNAATCRPVFTPVVARVGPETGEPEKDSIGRAVQRVECGPG